LSSPVTTAAPYRSIEKGDVLELGFLAKYYRINAINVPKGEILVPTTGSATYLIAALTAVNYGQFYVGIENKDNSAGSDGDLSIAVASDGDLVALIAGAALKAGEEVKVGATTQKLTRWVPGTDALELKVGVYVGKEAATFARASSTPFTETLNGSRIFPADAADTDVIGVRLGR